MKIKKKTKKAIKRNFKTSFITILVILWTVTWYASITTLNNWDPLDNAFFNTFIDLINVNETKLTNITDNWAWNGITISGTISAEIPTLNAHSATKEYVDNTVGAAWGSSSSSSSLPAGYTEWFVCITENTYDWNLWWISWANAKCETGCWEWFVFAERSYVNASNVDANSINWNQYIWYNSSIVNCSLWSTVSGSWYWADGTTLNQSSRSCSNSYPLACVYKTPWASSWTDPDGMDVDSDGF